MLLYPFVKFSICEKNHQKNLSTSYLTPTTISRSEEGVGLWRQTATSGDCHAADTTSDRTSIEVI